MAGGQARTELDKPETVEVPDEVDIEYDYDDYEYEYEQ